MTMRKLLTLIVLAIVIVLAILQFGPSLLHGEEVTPRSHAGAGSGPAFVAGNGLKVIAITKAPSPNAQEPI